MINHPLGEILELKQRAAALRDRQRYDVALRTLDEALNRLESMRVDATDDLQLQSMIQTELADAHGMKGGVFRRMGNPTAAMEEYGEGVAIEGAEGQGTYNLSNHIMLSLTLAHERLDSSAMQERIERLLERLKRQTEGARRDDWWAWADLAQYLLLKGDIGSAFEAYQRGRSIGASAEDMHRSLEVLAELGRALESDEPEVAQRIGGFCDRMRRSG